MTIPVPNLDDRRFQDIVDETKQRIAEHCPEWTNHNISDPGITLVELFAYVAEMTLYRLNRVPDRLYSVFLNMVGIEPAPVVPARTDLLFRVTPRAQSALLPSRIEVATLTDTEGSVVFITEGNLLLRPPQLEACLTRAADGLYRDRWDALRFEETSVACFEPLQEGAAAYLGFAAPLSRHVIRLRMTGETLGRGIVPVEPPLGWYISTERGWAPVRVLSDETGGLNRSGDIELALPDGHAPLRLGEVDAHWLRIVFEPKEGHHRYSQSPAIRTLHAETIGGLVSAFHGEPLEQELLGVSDGTPGQRFSLSRRPVLSPRWESEDVLVVTPDGSEVWEEREHFGYSGPTDHHVVWHPGTGEIEFGPEVRVPGGGTSRRGAVPTKGAQIIVTGYRTGGGTVGNVGAGTLRVMRTSVPFVQGVTNLDAATGGEDAETVEATRRRAPVTLRTGRRAVTPGDFERLAVEASSRVARAHCIDRRDGLPVVRLLLIPTVDGDPSTHTIDDFVIDDVYDAVQDHLDARRLVGTSIRLGTPYYEGVSITARVTSVTDADPRVVEARCRDALFRYTHPIVGGPHGDGVPFGWTLTVDGVRTMLAKLDGVAAVDDVVIFTADLRNGRRIAVGTSSDEADGSAGSPGEVTLDEDAVFLGFRHEVAVR